MRILYYAISLDNDLESSSRNSMAQSFIPITKTRAVWGYATMSCPSRYVKSPADT
jgi:hypothetical protein